MSVSCRVIMEAMEGLAPRYLAESWDNVGLLIGSPDQTISKTLVTLDVTLPVARYAAQNGYDLIISHHPPIFKGITNIRTDSPQGEMLALLLQHSIAVYAAHTNLDIAAGGVNDVLAARLKLDQVKPLVGTYEDKLIKLVVFVPSSHAEQVRQSICAAGAGHIGNYSHCTFQTQGKGTFLPLAETNPFLGKQGQLEDADEVRLETVMPQSLSKRVLAAMLTAHPYEEVAYDLVPLANAGRYSGLGRKGILPKPVAFLEFLTQVKTALGIEQVSVAGRSNKNVHTVAICGGSGAGLIGQAVDAGADVLITGDVKYHEAQEAVARGLTVIDAGHFATEQPVVDAVVDYLRKYFQKAEYKFIVQSDPVNHDIFQVF